MISAMVLKYRQDKEVRTMIKPHGAESLKPLFVSDQSRNEALLAEAEALPSLLLNSAAAANAVMLGAGYFTPLDG